MRSEPRAVSTTQPASPSSTSSEQRIEIVPRRALDAVPVAWDPDGNFVGTGPECAVWDVQGNYRGDSQASCQRWREAARGLAPPDASRHAEALMRLQRGDTTRIEISPFENLVALVSADHVRLSPLHGACPSVGHRVVAPPPTDAGTWSATGQQCIAPPVFGAVEFGVVLHGSGFDLPVSLGLKAASSQFTWNANGSLLLGLEPQPDVGHEEDTANTQVLLYGADGQNLTGGVYFPTAMGLREPRLSADGKWVAWLTKERVEVRATSNLEQRVWTQRASQPARWYQTADSSVLAVSEPGGVRFVSFPDASASGKASQVPGQMLTGQLLAGQVIPGQLIPGQLPERPELALLKRAEAIELIEADGIKRRCVVPLPANAAIRRADFSVDSQWLALSGQGVHVVRTRDCAVVAHLELSHVERALVRAESGTPLQLVSLDTGGTLRSHSLGQSVQGGARVLRHSVLPSTLSPTGEFICDGRGGITRVADGAEIYSVAQGDTGLFVMTDQGMFDGPTHHGALRLQLPVLFRIGGVESTTPLYKPYLSERLRAAGMYRRFWQGDALPSLPALTEKDVAGPRLRLVPDPEAVPGRGSYSLVLEVTDLVDVYMQPSSRTRVGLGRYPAGTHALQVPRSDRGGIRVFACYEATGACGELLLFSSLRDECSLGW